MTALLEEPRKNTVLFKNNNNLFGALRSVGILGANDVGKSTALSVPKLFQQFISSNRQERKKLMQSVEPYAFHQKQNNVVVIEIEFLKDGYICNYFLAFDAEKIHEEAINCSKTNIEGTYWQFGRVLNENGNYTIDGELGGKYQSLLNDISPYDLALHAMSEKGCATCQTIIDYISSIIIYDHNDVWQYISQYLPQTDIDANKLISILGHLQFLSKNVLPYENTCHYIFDKDKLIDIEITKVLFDKSRTYSIKKRQRHFASSKLFGSNEICDRP